MAKILVLQPDPRLRDSMVRALGEYFPAAQILAPVALVGLEEILRRGERFDVVILATRLWAGKTWRDVADHVAAALHRESAVACTCSDDQIPPEAEVVAGRFDNRLVHCLGNPAGARFWRALRQIEV